MSTLRMHILYKLDETNGSVCCHYSLSLSLHALKHTETVVVDFVLIPPHLIECNSLLSGHP